MADHNKGGFISKAQKRLTRTKTKVLQNLGKAEKTSDERFDENVLKLEKQQEVAHRFQKELRNYIHCAKAMEMASKSFYAVMSETYEPDWKGETTLKETLQALELMWSDYLQHLQESVQEPLTTYSSHFHPLKQRISKRNRKLDYFDNARHNAEVQQNAKKKDDVKIQKANEEMEESKRVYEMLNNELHHELPEFHNSRINFYASTFKSFFNAENTFHNETGKLNDTAMTISEQLAEEHKQFTYQPRPLSGVITSEDSPVNGHSDNGSTHSTEVTPSKREKSTPKPDQPTSSPTMNLSSNVAGSTTTPVKTNGEGLTNGHASDPESPPESPQTEKHDDNEQHYDAPQPQQKTEETKREPETQEAQLGPKIVEAQIETKTEDKNESQLETAKIDEKPKDLDSNDEKSEVSKSNDPPIVPQVEALQRSPKTDAPKASPRTSRESKKGPLYENSDMNFSTQSKEEPTDDDVKKKIDLDEPVDTYEEPLVNSDHSVVNGTLEEEIKKEIEQSIKQTPPTETTETSTPTPSQPPNLPSEPPPEDEDDDIPEKVAPPVQKKDDDESDHYYDRVPDQLEASDSKDNDDDDVYEVPSSAKIPDKLPAGTKYVVVATHLYKNEDEDELEFEAGELIYVVEFDDPDDQDDGWLMGIKKSDGQKGVFPENFTKRV